MTDSKSLPETVEPKHPDLAEKEHDQWMTDGASLVRKADPRFPSQVRPPKTLRSEPYRVSIQKKYRDPDLT